MYPQDPKIHECLGRVLAHYSTQMDLLKEQEGSDVKAEMLSVSLKKQAMQFMDATINLRYVRYVLYVCAYVRKSVSVFMSICFISKKLGLLLDGVVLITANKRCGTPHHIGSH